MGPEIRLADGIQLSLNCGLDMVADASAPEDDVNLVSHAHGDHLFSTAPAEIVCSETTAALAATRRDEGAAPSVVSHPRVELVNAGHVPGSTAALIHDTDTRILYTGDISVRDRFYLTGFQPPDADILIIESTYGKPEYELPPQAAIEQAMVDWLNDTMDIPIIVFGYSLGRAQEVQLLGMRSDRERIYVSDAIMEINRVIEQQLDVRFEGTAYTREVELTAGEMLILPSQTNQLGFVDDIIESTGAKTAGVSGWAVDSSFKYRGDFDETFALSDHCGFGELLDVVERVDPDQVYTHHGFADELAQAIRSRRGYPAQSLKRDQATLGDF